MKRLLSLQISVYASPLPDNYLVAILTKEFCYLKTQQCILFVVRSFRNLFSFLYSKAALLAFILHHGEDASCPFQEPETAAEV